MADENTPKSLSRTILGYACAIGVAVTTVIVIPCSQILGDRIPQFETNFIRFCIQLLFSISLLVVHCKDPRITLEWIPVGVLCVSTASTFSTGIFFIISSWYLPAAVVDGILENVIIILAAICTIFIGHCNVVIPIAVFTSIFGNILLFQPPFIFHYYDQIIPNRTVESDFNHTSLLNCTHISWCNETDLNDMNNCTRVICNAIPLQDAEPKGNSLLGFIYSVVLGLSFWIHEQINVPYLVNKRSFDVDVIFFWISIGAFIPSIGAMYFDKQLILPKNGHDIGLVIFLSVGLIAGTYLVMHSVVLITPTHTALILPLAVVVLFVAQKTILKGIQPGPGNWMEKVGLVMIIIASISPAVFDLLQYRKSKKAKYGTPKETSRLLPDA